MKEVRLLYPDHRPGMFDYIRCLTLLYQQFEDKCKIVPVTTPLSAISKSFIWSTTEVPDKLEVPFFGYCDQESRNRTIQTINDFLESNEQSITIFSYAAPDFTKCTPYKWLIQGKPEYEEPASEKAKQLIDQEYHCIHVRTHDHYKEEQIPQYINEVSRIASDSDLPIVLVCNQEATKKHLVVKNVLNSPVKPKHSGWSSFTEQDIIGWFTDVKLIYNAKKVTSVVGVDHKSSCFSKLPCAMYEIPLAIIPINQ